MSRVRDRRCPRALRTTAVTAGALVLALPLAASECPPGDAAERLQDLPLDGASRTAVVELEVPRDLYRKALAAPDKGFVKRDKHRSQGVMLATVSADAFWMALNDEDRHDEGGYLPLRVSEVISGSPEEDERRTFQYFQKLGIGRWWVNRLDMNEQLYAATEGRMWELFWEDVLDEYPDDEPPVAIDAKVPKVVGSVGAWLLMPMGEGCTLVEYGASGDLGGVIGAMQWLGATRTLRNTMEGMLSMARQYASGEHATGFVRPDGTPIELRP